MCKAMHSSARFSPFGDRGAQGRCFLGYNLEPQAGLGVLLSVGRE